MDGMAPGIVVTGAASGMGAAVVTRLGAAALGIDRHRADVCADLSTRRGRARAVSAVMRRTGGSIRGLVACAGLSGHTRFSAADVVSVNYFGAVELLTALRPTLARGAPSSAVVVGSIGPLVHPVESEALVDLCLGGDEDSARRVADASGRQAAYQASKLAIARWVRRSAPTAAWIGTDITLNCVMPGLIRTPMVEEALGESSGRGAVERFAGPIGRAGAPHEVAALIDFLLGPECRYMVGASIVLDGGVEALLRADDWPSPPRLPSSRGRRTGAAGG